MTIISNFPAINPDIENHLNNGNIHVTATEKEKFNEVLNPVGENVIFAVPGKNGSNILEATDNGETSEFSIQDNLNAGTDNVVVGIGASARGRHCVTSNGNFYEIQETNGNIVTLYNPINSNNIQSEVILCSTSKDHPPKKIKLLNKDKDGYNITLETEEDLYVYDYVVTINQLSRNNYYHANHAEGAKTIACGQTGSHAEGFGTLAGGRSSHAENRYTKAIGVSSHAEGTYTIASSPSQHVQGQYNIEDNENTYADIVGNGSDEDDRSNAYTLDWQGNGWFAGDVESATAGKLSEKANNDLSNVTAETLKAAVENSGFSRGKRTCRFVVGTSTAGWTEADCDYLCDGVSDEVEIQAAIDALPATGGEILLLDGTYNISDTININKYNCYFRGNGITNTILKMNRDLNYGIYLYLNKFQIENLTLSTDIPTDEILDNIAGNIIGINTGTNVNNLKINNVKIEKFCQAIYLRGTSQITNSYIDYCYIGIVAGSGGNHIISNRISNCITGINSSNGNIINNNFINSPINSSNIMFDNSRGILARSTYNCIISDNIIDNSYYFAGIALSLTTADKESNCIVSNNIISRWNDYAENEYSIHIAPNYKGNARLLYNSIMGKNYVDSSNSTTNEFIGNKFE